MFDEMTAGDLLKIAIVAVLVGAGLAALPRSRSRTALIWGWCLAPVILALGVMAALISQSAEQVGFSATFFAVFVVFALPLWSGLALIPYHFVRRWREIHAGIDYRNGS
jgi:Na+/H+-dicarboxylate symporter